jgi:hypothetical protein
MRIRELLFCAVVAVVVGAPVVGQDGVLTYELTPVVSLGWSSLGLNEREAVLYSDEETDRPRLSSFSLDPAGAASVEYDDGTTMAYLYTVSDRLVVLHGQHPKLSIYFGEDFLIVTTEGDASTWRDPTADLPRVDLYEQLDPSDSVVTERAPSEPGTDTNDDWTETEVGSLRIDRVWHGSSTSYPVIYALVTYRNTTDTTFGTVTLTGRALADDGSLVAQNRRSFFQHEYGSIRPGFEESVEIPIELPSAEASSRVSVTIRARRP